MNVRKERIAAIVLLFVPTLNCRMNAVVQLASREQALSAKTL